MAKKEKNKTMEATLWAACNKQRGSVSATDYVNVVLGLLFLRFAFDKYNAQRQKLLANGALGIDGDEGKIGIQLSKKNG